MRETERQTSEWRRGCASVLAAGILLTLLVLVGGLSIVDGQIKGPSITVRIGAYQIVSRTTTTPDCHPLTMGCVAVAPRAGSASAAYYTIWVQTLSESPIAGGMQEHLSSARVLMLPVGR